MRRLLLWLSFGGWLAGRVVLATSASSNSAPDWVWTLNVPGARGYAVVTDTAGNVYITGGFGATVAFGTTNLISQSRGDLFVAKVDPSGQFVWASQTRGSRDASVSGQAIALDSIGNVYVAGRLSEEVDFGPTKLNSGYFTWVDAFLAKYDSAGRCQWAWQGNSRNDPYAYCSAVVVDSNDDVIISGHCKPGIFCGEGGDCLLGGWHDAFIAKFNGAGAVQWYEGLGGAPWGEANALAIDDANNVYVTGYFSRDSGAGTIGGVSDIYVAKYNSDGDLQWFREAGAISDGNDASSSYDEGLGVVVDRLGAVYVTGSFAGGEVTFGETNLVGGTRDFFLAKYRSAGELDWVRKGYGTLGTGIAVDGAGHVYTTVSPPFIHKYDAAGNFLWTKDAGPGQGFVDAAITIAPDGSKYITTDHVFLRKLDYAGTGPRLSIATSAENVTLSWQLAAVDYGPHVANDLAAPDWRPVSGTDGTNGVFRTLTVPRPNQNRFYRLQKNPDVTFRNGLTDNH